MAPARPRPFTLRLRLRLRVWGALVGLCLGLGLGLGVGGCQALPKVVAIQDPVGASDTPTSEPVPSAAAMPASAPVRLKGARGALSAAQSKQVLAGLRSRQQDNSIFDRHLAVEEALAGAPLTTGNAVRLLQDGPQTYAAMLKAIAAAQNHINMETYILDDDEVGQRFANALLDKQSQGVQVNLIHDSVGTLATPRAFFDRLRDAGVQVLEFNPVNPLAAWPAGKAWSPNQRDHRKLLIVDGHTAFLGGINISSVYSGGSRTGVQRRPPSAEPGRPPKMPAAQWRDTHLQLQGPVVAELQKLFLASWAQQNTAPLPKRDYFPTPRVMGPHVVRAIASTPSDDDSSPIYATLLSAIGSADTSVYITNAYFVPDPQLLAVLGNAAGRGVDVQMVLPGQTDSWLTFHAGRAHYDGLLRAGVKIHQRQDKVLHAKTVVIDGVWSSVGSTNLDWRSFLHNQEVNAVVLGAEFGGQMRDMFEQDRRASEPLLLPAWQSRPWLARLKEFFAQFWAYWL